MGEDLNSYIPLINKSLREETKRRIDFIKAQLVLETDPKKRNALIRQKGEHELYLRKNK